MLTTIDLNSDLGEHYGVWTLSNDAALLPIVTSANIPTGFHAGDPSSLEHTLRLAAEHGVRVGAHVSYPDLQGFGRRPMSMPPAELRASVIYQIGALNALAESLGTRISYVKPHGALYHAMSTPDVGEAIVDALGTVSHGLPLMTLAGAPMASRAAEAGIPVVQEVFADRGYNADGSLMARGIPGALITLDDHIRDRVRQLATEGTITAHDGTRIAVPADSICVHGDTPEALRITQLVASTLRELGVTLAAFTGQE